ncbi:MAG: 2-hydroxycyclohexanecarboxyl-CoA dehydrogenase [Mycobacterium sp.]|nr:2-hydroxycyclohexanecarboxyl-CoA dehydrogenase [Mycobacterium sp.]
MDIRLNGRVAVVTGGGSGIGRACVDAFAAAGAKVVIVDRDPAGQAVADLHRNRGGRVEFVCTDITDESDVERAIQHALDVFGAVDSVCGCAGISGPVGKRVVDVSVEEWDRVQAVNVRGNFLLAKHSIAHLAGSDIGILVFLASDSAMVAFEGMAAYSASKGALVMLAKSLSVDYPRVRVNALCPGIVDTPMSRADLDHPDGFASTGLPVLSARDVANHVLFLASPLSFPTNGATLIVHHGVHVRSALGTLNFTTY